MKTSKQVCLIVCMHRSGSSALSALVSSMGFSVGENIMPAKRDNPNGFWENQAIVDLNDEMLSSVGCRWDLPSVQSWQSCNDILCDAFLHRAEKLVATEFDEQNQNIIIKDPRLINLLPFWKAVLIGMGFEINVVFIYRNPEEVYQSLNKRNGFSRGHSHVLWLDSLTSLCEFSEEETLIVDYDTLLHDYEVVAQELKAYLSLGNELYHSGLNTFSKEYLDLKLHHHQVLADQVDNSVAGQVYMFLKENSGVQVVDKIWLKEILDRKNKLQSEHEAYRLKLHLHLTAIVNANQFESISNNEAHLSCTENGILGLARKKVERSARVSEVIVNELNQFRQDSERRQMEVLNGLEREKRNSKRTKKAFAKLNKKINMLLLDLSKERKANDWLREKLDEEAEGRTWLQEKLNESSFRLLEQTNVISKFDTHIRSLLGSYSYTLSQIKMSRRWKVGDGVISCLQMLRLSRSKFPQFDIAEKEIQKQYKRLDSELDLSINDEESNEVDIELLKHKHSAEALKSLQNFLDSGECFDFRCSDKADLTIILVLYNKAELTYLCLRSLANHFSDLNYELVIVNNGSSDSTPELLGRVRGIKLIDNQENLGFLLACNQAVENVSSPAVLFLNNDVELFENCLDSAYKTLFSKSKIGAVGGKIILLDGTLQEAGSFVWNDGSCSGYGRGGDPDSFEYQFQRDVDFVSGAFLMTKSELLRKTEGFDDRYAPAYYEEVDYCFELEKLGYRCVYEPQVSVRHYEFGSAEESSQAHDLMVKNREIFAAKHQNRLLRHLSPFTDDILAARSSVLEPNVTRILYIDDRVPHGYYGSGFPRSNSVLNTLAESGNSVTMLPLNFPHEETLGSVYTDIDRRIEIARGVGREKFKDFLTARFSYYDILWISRPHNMEFVLPIIEELKSELTIKFKPKIVYDAEAIFADREKSLAIIKPNEISDRSVKKLLNEEISLAKQADVVVAVCKKDRETFRKNLPSSISTFRYGFVIDVSPSHVDFAKRKGLLFVGNLDRDNTPNVDSLLWFYEKVWPALKSEIPDVTLSIVGSNQASSLEQIKDESIKFYGRVDDIDQYYSNAKVFIAPTRFAAGIPYKLHEAAAKGLPCVATDLLVKQSGWENDLEVLSAKVNDHDTFLGCCVSLLNKKSVWEKIRNNALNRVTHDCSKQQASDTLESIVKSIKD